MRIDLATIDPATWARVCRWRDSAAYSLARAGYDAGDALALAHDVTMQLCMDGMDVGIQHIRRAMHRELASHVSLDALLDRFDDDDAAPFLAGWHGQPETQAMLAEEVAVAVAGEMVARGAWTVGEAVVRPVGEAEMVACDALLPDLDSEWAATRARLAPNGRARVVRS